MLYSNTMELLLLIGTWCGTPTTQLSIVEVNKCRVKLYNCVSVISAENTRAYDKAFRQCFIDQKLGY